MNLDNNHQKYANWALHTAGLLAIAIVLTTFYKIGYTQLIDQNAAHTNRVEQLHQLLATADSVKLRHHALRQELDDLEQEAATMHRRLPHDLQRDQFEGSVQKAANQVGFNFLKATWDTPKPTPSHSLAEVTIHGDGSFASICQFLSEINQLARITKISRLLLENESESDTYPFQVTFVLVYGIKSNDTNRKEGVL